MYGTFREDQPVDEISAYLIEIFTFISVGDPRSKRNSGVSMKGVSIAKLCIK